MPRPPANELSPCIDNPKMGFIIPGMGSRNYGGQTSIADALFTNVQKRVLSVLFGHTDRSFYANEIIKLAKSGTGAVQRELARLHAAGLITMEQIGRQKHYQANPNSPLFAELRGIVLKTTGLADVLREALQPVAKDITAACIFGSIARSEDHALSDIDLLVISDTLAYGELFAALEAASELLGRPVNPTLYTPGEWAARLQEDNAFVTRLTKRDVIWIIGDESAFRAG